MSRFNSNPRFTVSKFDCVCKETGKKIKKGQAILYFPDDKSVYHTDSKEAQSFRENQQDEENLLVNDSQPPYGTTEGIVTENLLKAFDNDEYAPVNDVHSIRIYFSKKFLNNLREVQRLCKKKDYWSICVHPNGDCKIIYLDEEQQGADFITGVEYFIIYPDSIVLYAQSKYDSGVYLESESFNVSDDLLSIIKTNQ